MRFCVLGSGSKGNCTYVTSGNTSLLIDAGFSGVEVERRLAAIGVDISEISAILVTHEHSDHVKGVAVLSRRFQLPVFVNNPTRIAAGKYLENLSESCSFATGSSFTHGDLHIHPFSISHDCQDPVGYTISHGALTLGYCTDTGVLSKLIRHRLFCCQGLVLECNHDLDMLRDGPYPLALQQRVRSVSGHLANPQAVEFLKELSGNGLQQVVLAHVSEANNSPDIILKMVAGQLSACSFQIAVASQDSPGEIFELKVKP